MACGTGAVGAGLENDRFGVEEATVVGFFLRDLAMIFDLIQVKIK